MDSSKQYHYYFAYGSNMNPGRMKDRGVSFITRELARLPGYTLAFNKKVKSNGTAAANILVDEKSTVYGALYACCTEHVFHQLDKYEGVKINHYYREQKTVFLESGKAITAVVYIANKEKCENGLLIHPAYLDHLLCGQDLLPEQYFNFLKTFKKSCCEDDTIYYLSYGTDVDCKKIADRGISFAKRELGILHDHQVEFNKLKKNGMLAPNLFHSKSSVVYGVLYSFHDNKPFEDLDKANGVRKGHYHRSTVPVQRENGVTINAQTYFAGDSFICNEPKQIDPDTFDHLIASKDILPVSYLESLIKSRAETSQIGRLLEKLNCT